MGVSFDDFRFDTERLRIGEGHRAAERAGLDLPPVVVELMTARTTQALPDSWRGDYSVERAEQWIAERDSESPTLLVVDRQTDEVIGLLFLFVDTSSDAETDVSADAEVAVGDVRIGYLLSDAMWGQGIGAELVAGLVARCRTQPGIATVTAGVEASNVASVRILVKNGFALVRDDEDSDDALTYRVGVGVNVDSELRGE